MRLRWLERGKTLHCYHLVIIKAAACVQFFAAPGAGASSDVCASCELLSMMFLICSFGVLCSLHEPSILSCPQAPAGHGALRTGGSHTFFRASRCHSLHIVAWP